MLSVMEVISVVNANPKGETIVSGQVTLNRDNAAKLIINQQSKKAIINWQDFSIGRSEEIKIIQPSTNSVVLNRVISNQVSNILGTLTANGKVFLINPNGVVFGNGSKVDVSALITSTHDIKDNNFLSDTLSFTISGDRDAKIINEGTISVAEGGLVALVAPSLKNAGIIYARLGRVALAAGNAVTIDPYGDDLISFEVDEKTTNQLISANKNSLAGLIDLSGSIIAKGGGVLITVDQARNAVDNAINMTGYIQAKSLHKSAGKIILDGGKGDINLEGIIQASGTAGSDGGEIRVLTDGNLKTTDSMKILATGDQSGDGGFVAVSSWAQQEIANQVSVKGGAESENNGWLYVGENIKAARTFKNPNDEGAGKVGAGSKTVYFEKNIGQTEGSVKYLTRGEGQTLYLTAADAVMAMQTTGGHEKAHLALEGSNKTSEVIGEDKQKGTINYFIGNDQDEWISGAETFKKVRYKDIYDGIDLVYYGNKAGNLEYDLQVRAGADPNQIKVAYEGAESLTKTKEGDLIVQTGTRQIVQKAPLVYQEDENARILVPSFYQVDENKEVTFKLDKYDSLKELVIDPVIKFSSYLGGNANENSNFTGRVATDTSGNSYYSGKTSSSNFLTTASAYDTSRGGVEDAFVTKINSDGSLGYSTYFGGSGSDKSLDVAVNSLGNAFIVGQTNSTNMPTVNPAVVNNNSSGGNASGFVAKIAADGQSLLYSTYLGDTGNEAARGVAVDQSGKAFVVGRTTSASNIATGSADQASYGGSGDAFISIYDTSGNLNHSTYLGGASDDRGNNIAVDSAGNYFVAGKTMGNFPTVSAAQGSIGGSYDAFVVKYNSSNQKVFSTYLGGAGNDEATGIKSGTDGNFYVGGYTASTSFPTVNAEQSVLNGSRDAFLTKYNAGGSVAFSTLFGGSGQEYVYGGLDVDSNNNVFIGGATNSTDLPIASSIQASNSGGYDGFLAGFNSQGQRIFSSYYGGTAEDIISDVTIGPKSSLNFTGYSLSSNLQMVSALDGTLGGTRDAFIGQLSFGDLFPVAIDPLVIAKQRALKLNKLFTNNRLLRKVNLVPNSFSALPVSNSHNFIAGEQKKQIKEFIRKLLGVPPSSANKSAKASIVEQQILLSRISSNLIINELEESQNSLMENFAK